MMAARTSTPPLLPRSLLFDRPAVERDPDHDLICGVYGPTQADGQIPRCQVPVNHKAGHRCYADVEDVLAEWARPYQPVPNPTGDVLVTLRPDGYPGRLPKDSFYTRYPDWRQLRDLLGSDPLRAHLPTELDVSPSLEDEIEACYRWADRLVELGRNPTRLLLEASMREAIRRGWLSP